MLTFWENNLLEEVKKKSECKNTITIFRMLLIILVAGPLLGQFLPTTIIGVIQLLAVITILYKTFIMYKLHQLLVFTGYKKLLYVLLSFITAGIILRGDWSISSFNSFFLMVINGKTLCFLFPLVLLVLPTYKYIIQISELFYHVTLLTLVLWLISPSPLITEPGVAESIGAYLPFFAFFSMAFSKSNNKRNIIMWGIIAIYLVLMLLNARRNMAFSLIGFSFALYYANYINAFKNKLKKVLSVLFLILVVLCIYSNIQFLATGVFAEFTERLTIDSRTGYNEMLLADFAISPLTDWIFGRGMSGDFYLPWNDVEGISHDFRNGIETGYLNMLLKGGLVYIFVVVSYMLTAMKLVMKKNIFLFFSILIFSVDMYSTCSINNMSSKMILFWLVINLSYSLSCLDKSVKNELEQINK